jgi:hypothetical protein
MNAKVNSMSQYKTCIFFSVSLEKWFCELKKVSSNINVKNIFCVDFKAVEKGVEKKSIGKSTSRNLLPKVKC